MKLLLKLILLISSSLCMARPLTISAPDWPPFFIQDATDRLGQGMGWDLLNICMSRLHVSVAFESYPIARMFKYMEGGRLDLNIMSYKPERLQFMDFGREMVFENNYNIWVRENLSQKLRKISDLETLNLAFLIGSKTTKEVTSLLELRQRSKNTVETIYVNEQEQIIRMLAAGHSDATITSSPEFKWRLKMLKLEGKIFDTGVSIQSQSYYVVASKQSEYYKRNPNLLKQVDQCIKDLKSQGTWNQLKRKYEL